MTDAAALLTIAEAAAQLRVSVRTLKRELAAGAIARVPIRGCVRILASDLAAYLEARRRVACPSVATEKVGRPAFSIWGIGLAARLGPGRTRSNSKGSPSTGSRIIALADHRGARSRKRSTAG